MRTQLETVPLTWLAEHVIIPTTLELCAGPTRTYQLSLHLLTVRFQRNVKF